jgi:hypothetical protein
MGNIDDAVNEAGLSNRSKLANTLRAQRGGTIALPSFSSDLQQEVLFDETPVTVATVNATGHIAGDRWFAQGFLQLDSLSAAGNVTGRLAAGEDFFNPSAVFTASAVDGGFGGSASLIAVYVALSSDPFDISLQCAADVGESGIVTGTITLTNMGQP